MLTKPAIQAGFVVLMDDIMKSCQLSAIFYPTTQEFKQSKALE